MWISTPSTTSPSAPAAEASTSPLSWQFQALARSAWWRGKPMPPEFWALRWRKESWLRALCGQMPEPSAADHGVALWMVSLAASRASRTPKPASSLAKTMSATYGPRPAASLSSQGLGGSSSKTSAACSGAAAWSGSAVTFSVWVGTLRLDYSRRKSAATLRNGSASSSSRWPAPIASDHRSIYATEATHEKNSRPLREVVGRWCAPTVACATGGQISRGGDRQEERLLGGQALHVSSLLAPMTSQDGSNTSPFDRTLNPRFVSELMGWPTGLTDFACSETELSRFRERMRSELLRIGLPPAAPPAQTDLFG